MASIFDTLTMPTTTEPADIFGKVGKGAVDFYSTLNTINQAKYGSKLVKAQAQAAVQQARAQGYYDASATQNLPSPALLLVGGLGLAALMILKR